MVPVHPEGNNAMPIQDSFSAHYAELCDGDYDCVDRIVLTGYFRFAQAGGGFRLWWRAWFGSDDKLNNAQLMRIPAPSSWCGRSREVGATIVRQKVCARLPPG